MHYRRPRLVRSRTVWTIGLTLASVPNYGLDDGELKQVISSRPAGLDGRSISGRRAGK